MIDKLASLHFYVQIAIVLGVSYVLGKAMMIPVIIVEVLADFARANLPKRGKS